MHRVAQAALVGLSLLIALLVDAFLVGTQQPFAAIYAIPILIAARLMRPLSVGVVGIIAVGLHFAASQLRDIALVVWPYYVLGLVVIAALAVSFSAAREEAARRTREAEEARRRLQQYLGMVAHELGGPLTVIIGQVQLARRAAERERQDREVRRLRTIEDQTRRIRRLVDDLRDAAQIGAGRFAVQPSRTDLVAVVRQAVDSRRDLPDIGPVTLETPEQLEGEWDPERIGQIIENLISNAVKFSPPGSEVAITVRQADGEVVISVADRGVGIVPEQRDRLFQPFSRLGPRDAIKGIGLGLYISRAIAEAHGGRIWVESEPGRGSTLHVALPRPDGDAAGRSPGPASPP